MDPLLRSIVQPFGYYGQDCEWNATIIVKYRRFEFDKLYIGGFIIGNGNFNIRKFDILSL